VYRRGEGARRVGYKKEANKQGTALLNTVELDVGWQVPRRNLEIDYKRDIWPI